MIAIAIFLRKGSNFPLLAEEMGMLDGRKRKVEEDMDPGSATCEVVWSLDCAVWRARDWQCGPLQPQIEDSHVNGGHPREQEER